MPRGSLILPQPQVMAHRCPRLSNGRAHANDQPLANRALTVDSHLAIRGNPTVSHRECVG